MSNMRSIGTIADVLLHKLKRQMQERKKYSIEPLAEFNGEGNGWDDATDEQATHFAVFDLEKDEQVAGFDTRADAEAWVRNAAEQEQVR